MSIVRNPSSLACLPAAALALCAACATPGKPAVAQLAESPVVAAELVAADPRGVIA